MKAKMEKTTNKELRDRVEKQLEWEPEVTSTDIGVAADDGIVTLSGFVSTYSEKLAAEKAAQKTFGVRALANDLVVRPIFKITDAEIAGTAIKAIEMRSNIPKEAIKVTVKEGYIYLSGTVDWKYQKDAAENAVAHLFGSKGVFNSIEVKARVSDIVVKDKIEEAFRRNAEIDARRLMITAHDTTVELWGNVRSWTEKREAERAAWAAPGVTAVNSHLHIVP
jgi:osmotically-inducible protein OsmY